MTAFRPSIISIAGAASACLYGGLSLWSYGAQDFWGLLFVLSAAFLLQLACALKLTRGASLENARSILVEIVVWAIVLRVIATTGMPLLEDDHFRFMWDGYMLVEYGSPYSVPPATFFDQDIDNDAMIDVLDQVNHPHLATIYGPVCQWIFAGAHIIAPAKVWPLQWIFAGFDIGIVLLLARFASITGVLLYAWCPLIIKEFAFTAHTDVMAVFFLVCACLLALSNRAYLAGSALALAVGSKIFAIVLVPLLIIKYPKSAFSFVVTLLGLYLPFANTLFDTSHGIHAMASGWVFNAPIHALTLGFLPPLYEWVVKAILVGLFALFWLYYAKIWLEQNGFSFIGRFKSSKIRSTHTIQEAIPRADWLYMAFILILPAINPWYWVWVLPFAAIHHPNRREVAPWAVAYALIFAYAIGLNLPSPGYTNTIEQGLTTDISELTFNKIGAYEQPILALVIEYSIILAAFAFDWQRRRVTSGS